jgi:hypothetical protein
MENDLNEIREEMDKIALKMQQEVGVHWRYEWPLNRKEKWPFQNLLARR